VVKNFLTMPIVLKLITASALVILLIVVSTIVPGGPIHVFGRDVTRAEWWAIGAGQFLFIVMLLMTASAVMMLRRARHSRLANIVAWIALSFSIPFVAGVTGMGVSESRPALISNLLLTLAISLYLYLSKGSRNYFRPAAK